MSFHHSDYSLIALWWLEHSFLIVIHTTGHCAFWLWLLVLQGWLFVFELADVFIDVSTLSISQLIYLELRLFTFLWVFETRVPRKPPLNFYEVMVSFAYILPFPDLTCGILEYIVLVVVTCLLWFLLVILMIHVWFGSEVCVWVFSQNHCWCPSLFYEYQFMNKYHWWSYCC